MSKNKRIFTPVKVLETEIFELKEEGKTNKEIAEMLFLPNVKTVKNAINRYNRRKRQVPEAIEKRGRPRKTPITSNREMELKIKQLEMENTVLKNFLYSTERGSELLKNTK
jgi:hypothetical protein